MSDNVHLLVPRTTSRRKEEQDKNHDLVIRAIRTLEIIGYQAESNAIAFLVETTNQSRRHGMIQPIADCLIEILPMERLAQSVAFLRHHGLDDCAGAVIGLIESATIGAELAPIVSLPQQESPS